MGIKSVVVMKPCVIIALPAYVSVFNIQSNCTFGKKCLFL